MIKKPFFSWCVRFQSRTIHSFRGGIKRKKEEKIEKIVLKRHCKGEIIPKKERKRKSDIKRCFNEQPFPKREEGKKKFSGNEK